MTPLLALTLLAAPAVADPPAHAGPAMPFRGSGSEIYVPQAGDLILFRNGNFFTRAAYYCTFSGGTTHVGLVVAGCDGRPCLLETVPGKGVLLCDLADRVAGYAGRMSVRRRIAPLTAEQSARMTRFACDQVGKPFHVLGLLAPPVSFPFRVFGRPVDPNCLARPRWICTSLALRTCIAAGLICPDEINPEGACPSDFATDRILDLSGGWHPPVLFAKPGE